MRALVNKSGQAKLGAGNKQKRATAASRVAARGTGCGGRAALGAMGDLSEPRLRHDFSRVRVDERNTRGEPLRGSVPVAGGFASFQISSMRPSAGRSAYLSDEGVEVENGKDSTSRLGQVVPVSPPAAGPPAPAAPAAGCTYAITYANIRRPGCGARCGAKIIYDITGVTATGAGCPSLTGLRVTESVTTDNGCTPGGVTTGAGCPIGAGGVVSGCTDTYEFCSSPASIPAAGCTEIYTQQLFVGGVLAETRTITWKFTRTGGGCSATVTRA